MDVHYGISVEQVSTVITNNQITLWKSVLEKVESGRSAKSSLLPKRAGEIDRAGGGDAEGCIEEKIDLDCGD